jgi:flagellin-like hook-associated protein FlgL
LGGSYRIAVVDVATGIYRTNSLTVAASTNIQQSSDGRFLTFNSGNNPLGTNADGNSEVFVGRIGDSLSLEQLTNTTGGANFALAITNSGLVTLQSNRNLSGTNSGLYNEFFQAYAGSQAFTQISTFQTAAIFRASVSTDGSTISFISSQNLTGENADGSAELFRLDSDLGRVLQMTSGADFNGEAFSLLADGSRVLMQLYDDGPVWVYDTSRAGTFVDFEVGAGESGRIAFDLESLLSTVQGLGHYDLSSAAMARLALDHARTRVADVALLRGTLGAQQSRLAVAESLVTSQRGELTVAEARLSNADIAVESATLLRAQILSQTGAALLGQANQQPQIVLRLLQQP